MGEPMKLPARCSRDVTTSSLEALTSPWGPLSRHIDDVDPAEVERLQDELRLDERRLQPDEVSRALDRAHVNLYRAQLLAAKARRDQAKAHTIIDTRMSWIRAKVRESLGKRSPTNTEVQDAAMIHPTLGADYASLMIERAEIDEVVRAAEGLASAWNGRAAALRELVKR